MANNKFIIVLTKNRMCNLIKTKLEDFDLDKILVEEKSHEDILIYDISYKTLIDPKPLRIRFFKIYGGMTIYDRSRCLTLFSS